jgi:eukaryotic-like serine/threonine-protein kinase
MTEELWAQVEEAYAEAVELPVELRAVFLNESYPDRPEIRLEVESLLEHKPVADRLAQSTVLLAAAEMFSDEEDELVGTTVADKYLVRERLGAGGMAEVYLADHIALKIPVALKRPRPELRSDAGFRRSFLEEARRAVSLNDENVARVHDVVDVGDDIFVVMEYIEGETLRRRLSALGRPFTVDEFLPIAIQCASALAAAHEKRIVHLDVKPENIMLTSAGQVKICDFGVAKRLSKDVATATTVIIGFHDALAGTPAYMAPEVVLRSSFDERADLFSLGIVFYEMLTGQNPFKADTIVATTARIVSHKPSPISEIQRDIDTRLERIVSGLLAKEPGQRYAAASDLVSELKTVHRSRRRFHDIAQNVSEAFGESLWLKTATAILLLLLVAVPAMWIYREPIEKLMGIIRLPEQKTLVVLPFQVTDKNVSRPRVDGLAEVLNERLGELPQLKVVSPPEVVESGITTPQQAFGLFGANLAVMGSIHQVDNIFQIILTLADGKEGKQLRGKTVTMPRFDSLDAQTEVIEAVVGLLSLELAPKQQLSLHSTGTRNPSAYDLYLQGKGYLATRKPEDIDRAIDLFRDALSQDSGFSLAYAGLGTAYRAKFQAQSRERQWADRAVEACDQAVSRDSNLAAGHICLGAAYNLRGDDQDAISEYDLARKLDPNNDEAYRGLARSHEALNNLEAAEAVYLAAVKAKPDYWYNYVWLANFYLFSRPQYAESAKWYKEAIIRAPDNHVPYFGLCGAQLMSGDYQEAVKACSTSIALHATDRAYINLGVAYFDLRQFSEAAQAFDRARVLNPVYYKPVGHLARAYYWMGKRDQAKELFGRAIELAKQELLINPGSPAVHVMLSRYYAMLNNRSEAFFNLGIALQKRPKEAEYQCIAAVVHNQFGERAEAIRYLESAVALGYSVTEIDAERELDNLREDPRFRALLADQTTKR